MKVLFNNTASKKTTPDNFKSLEEETFPQVIICPECKSEMEIEKEDCCIANFTYRERTIQVPTVQCICGKRSWLYLIRKPKKNKTMNYRPLTLTFEWLSKCKKT